MRYDVIVIGSGVAGMTAAVTLSREGRGVLVLEQAGQPGGLMQTFTRGGVRFPTGVHLVGSLGEGEVLWRYFKYMGILDSLRLVRMDPSGFLHLKLGQTDFVMPSGRETLRERLVERFPTEAAGIDRFVSDMASTVKDFALYNIEARPDMLPLEAVQRSLKEYLDRITSCTELKAIITALNPFYGVGPSECPLYAHFLVLDSFLSSAWRIDESEVTLVQAFEGALAKFGGKLRSNAAVTAVETTDGEARAVRLADGERIEAGTVVFTGHPKQLLQLCSDSALRPAYRSRVSGLEDTVGFVGAAAIVEGLKRPPDCGNSFAYADCDTQRQYALRTIASSQPPHSVFSSIWPVDGGRYALMALAASDCSEWETWAESRTGARPGGYQDVKHAAAERILVVAKSDGLVGTQVKFVDCFSPLTFRDYTLTPSGSAYGVKKTIGALSAARISVVTRVKGLYLAGQSVVLPGVVGTVISSIDACGAILGHERLISRVLEAT
jgi:all-trans-retinol 13,14-reductase